MRPVRCRLAIDEDKKRLPGHIKMDFRKIEMRSGRHRWLGHIDHSAGNLIRGKLALDQGCKIEVGRHKFQEGVSLDRFVA